MSGRAARDARLLGYAGLLPFAGGVLAAWAPGVPDAQAAACTAWTLLYGAVILSFMGGARWGTAMAAPAPVREPLSGFLGAVTPALAGWAAVVPEDLAPLPLTARLVLLATGFAGLLAIDLRAVRAGQAPAWYAPLRVRLTTSVLAALALIGLRAVL